MDGLFSLAAAADMLGDYQLRAAAAGRKGSGSVESYDYGYGAPLSPISKKRAGSGEPTTPLKRTRLGMGGGGGGGGGAAGGGMGAMMGTAPGSPVPPKSPGGRLPARSPGRLILPKSPAKFGIRSPMRSIIDSAVADDSTLRRSLTDSEKGGSAVVGLSRRFSSKLLRWCTYEWFYSSLDRDFFNENEFVTCLDTLGIKRDTPLSQREWSVVRSLMGERIGRPRRLSRAFLASERERLHHFRNCARSIQFGTALVPPEDLDDFPYPVYPAISVGDCVTAFHSQSGLLLRGQVLSVDLMSRADRVPVYRVQFEYPVLFSATFTDEELCIHGDLNVLTGESAPPTGAMQESAGLVLPSSHGSSMLADGHSGSLNSQQHMWEQTAALQYFLDRKENLIEALRVLQDEAARERSRWMKSAAAAGGGVGALDSAAVAYTKTFVEQRDWVTRNIDKTDRIVAQLMRRIDPSGQGLPSDPAAALKSAQASSSSSSSASSVGGGQESGKEGPGAVSEVVWRELQTAAEEMLGVTSSSDKGKSSADRLSVLCVTVLLMLKRYCAEEFCRPIELCQCVVGHLAQYKGMPEVQNIIGQVETICFGSSF